MDAIADDYLFQMDRKLEGSVIELCKNKEKEKDRSSEADRVQKEAFLAVHAEKEEFESKKVICMTR